MKKAFESFQKRKLTHQETETIKGGYANFCEWYLGLCNGDESSEDIQKALGHMMKYDKEFDFATANPEMLRKAYDKISKHL